MRLRHGWRESIGRVEGGEEGAAVAATATMVGSRRDCPWLGRILSLIFAARRCLFPKFQYSFVFVCYPYPPKSILSPSSRLKRKIIEYIKKLNSIKKKQNKERKKKGRWGEEKDI